MTSLLQPSFDLDFALAIDHFWRNRLGKIGNQSAGRSGVINGKNLDGFEHLVRQLVVHAGLPEGCVRSRKPAPTLPGYFRPSKDWDLLIIHNQRLLAILEFKSQVGSFGNNFNNRTEEALGNATDLAHVIRRGLVDPAKHFNASASPAAPDPRPPFTGYLMLLEDCPGSTRPIRAVSKNYSILPEFASSSYADRYRILCERLMSESLYSSAALVLTAQPVGAAPSTCRDASMPTSVRSFFTSLGGHLAAAALSP
jgi:hypothetical protein